MSAGSVIAIVAANAVALAAIGATIWQQRRGLNHERQMADRESVRGILSDAAAVLHRVEYALDSAHSTLLQWGGAFFENAERAKPYRDLEEIGREADGVLGQLRIRFGPDHPATLTFGDADTAMLDVFRALGMVKMEEPALAGTPAGEQMAQMMEEQRGRVGKGRENFRIAQERFVVAAHAAAGARL